jgi:hypothetical protein
MKWVVAISTALTIGLSPSPAWAQAARLGALHITVVDPSGAVIVGASVTVTGAEEATRAAALPIVMTTALGVATIAGMVPGSYTVEASFPGFETRQLRNVRVRPGDNKQVVLLQIQKVEDSVTVGQDRQEAAADPRGSSFGSTLTREQLEALSDDPQELRQQLLDMAGPGANIRIDSFEGGALPSKAQIRSIRISRDQFAAENHSAGGVFVEIITQPGQGPVRYFTAFRFRNNALSARSPFTPTKGPERFMNYNVGLSGALMRDKSSFNLGVFGLNSYETPNLNVALVNGTRSEALGIRAPRNNLGVYGQLDHALTLDQTLRFAVNMNRVTNENQGVGGFDVEERAFSTQNNFYNLRVQHMGPLGRRSFVRSRIQVGWSDSDTHSAFETVTIQVNDAFTAGGAQRAGGEHARTINAGADLDYVRGIHTFRTGVAVDGGWYRSNDTSNYLGTYTFESLEAFQDNRPKSYTRRIGDPNIRYRNFQGAIYVQDDIRVRRNLTLSPGIRYEAQTHVGDYANLGPRFGLTWAPFRGGATALRASWGIFYDWLPMNTYEQTLRVNGFRQQELNITDPAFPLPGDVGTIPPINRYLLGQDLRAPRNSRASVGVDQTLPRRSRVVATYSYIRGSELMRGFNFNAPVVGIRPDPAFGNIIGVLSDALSRQHQLQVDANVNTGALLPAPNGPLVDWSRVTLFVNYTAARLRNNTDGAFSIPASGDLGVEWGPAANDVRHRINASLNNQVIKNVLVSLNVNASTGSAYTIRTGRDENGDLVFNDRPVGVGRNTQRADSQMSVNLTAGYQWFIGRLLTPLPPGVGVFGGGGTAATVGTFDQGNARYRVYLFVQVQNLTNHANYAGYSGTLTSPFFGKPTTVTGTRKVDVGLNVSF